VRRPARPWTGSCAKDRRQEQITHVSRLNLVRLPEESWWRSLEKFGNGAAASKEAIIAISAIIAREAESGARASQIVNLSQLGDSFGLQQTGSCGVLEEKPQKSLKF
jgi:hypothetical protein